MSPTTALEKPAGRQCLRLSGVEWQTYSRLVWAFAEQRGVRLIYDRGELEIMSPLLDHDEDADFLGVLVWILTEELGLPIKPGGSPTVRLRKRERGLEADRCYWIANAHRMKGRRRLDLRTDPPPDLALEIDVTKSSLDRMSIYAALQVPEVWRLKDDQLSFHRLTPDGTYAVTDTSLSFPMVAPADLMRFVLQARQAGDDNAVLREFREWIRSKIKGEP
jgi:Uma2 family endonuclease